MRITANQVTFSRLILMPFLPVLLYGDEKWKIWTVIIGTVVGCTDFVDGYLARKQGPTVLGGLMDPIADKVFIAVGFLPFVQLGWLPWGLAAAIFVREFLITSLRSSYEVRKTVLKTSYLAKVKTWVQMVGLGLVLAMLVAGRVPMLIVMGFFCVFPLIGAVIFKLKTGRTWMGAIVGGFGFAVCIALYEIGGPTWLANGLFIAMVAITWGSGLSYVANAGKVMRDLRAFDAVRIVGGIALPMLAVLALVRADAPVWALIALCSLELAHGGLDTLLAHHEAAAGALSWGARVLGASAMLALALIVPAYAVPLAIAALAVSLVGTVAAFWKGRAYYLEERLREKKRAVATA